MKLSIGLAYFSISILTIFSFLIPKKKKYDLIIFPYAQKGSNGYTVRISCYFEYLEKDNIKYYVCDIFSESYILKELSKNKSSHYFLYQQIIWKRICQILKAKNYKSAFVQRGLFPYYPDYKNASLEKLLRRLNSNITIDFWDSVWCHSNSKLLKITTENCDKISVVNNYIKEYFDKFSTKKIIFPIGIDFSKYKVKSSYSTKGKITLFYTGLPGNVEHFLNVMKNILKRLNDFINFKLIIVSRARYLIHGIDIEYHDFDESTFFEIMANSDIGIYAVEDNDEMRGKMAMKVLDYMSSGLPCIATPIGITPYAVNMENIYFATSEQEWIDLLILLSENEKLRKNIGINGRNTVEKNHSIRNSYILFKKIINEPS
ncbi:MAG: hypothetical protein A2W98_04930 [Bacteroidetes bacterium GWF2_33_38]|nr:MAG: hypothetical protein A2W98_04930 [Bacteroidetes bacterium GWF2_33_38]OFY88663.1 MAG: hypothetical protein A2236_06620 [Bacteroidetes bacterium RIFOXYA2_FULL_33_7]